MSAIASLDAALSRETDKVVVGQRDAMRLLLIGLVCEGHVLLEGVPGTAKTTIARVLAAALELQFHRVQFTPDLMPSDIIGTQIYDFQRGDFHLVEGPVFTNLLLADEINRAPAKTQAALLEAMQERQVSIGGEAHPLPSPFLVLATQNPVEQQGTYTLPEAQLDRFLFKITLGYPDAEQEERILAQHRGDNAGLTLLLGSVAAIASPAELAAAKEEALAVRIETDVARYIVALVRATREHIHVQLGASPRAAVLLQVAARAVAALAGRSFVIPDDVKELLQPTLCHRLQLSAAAEVEGITPADVVREIGDTVPVPR